MSYVLKNIITGLGSLEWGYVLLFYLVASLVGLAFLPLTQWIFQRTRNGGLAFCRPLGLIVLTFLAWFLGSLGLPFSRMFLMLLLLACLLGNGALLVFHLRPWLASWKRNRRLLLITEVFFLGLYIGFAYLKAYYPEIHFTEKFADFAHLNSLTLGTVIPPWDAWLAGERVNYYYGGHMMAALLSKLSGIPTQYSHNLILAWWFAMASAGCFAIGVSLTGKARYGLLAAVICTMMSNPASFRDAIGLSAEDSGRAGKYIWQMNMWELDGVKWASSRVIEDPGQDGKLQPNSTISEYPWFAFVHSDLHAHMLALPFTVLILGYLWVWISQPPGRPACYWRLAALIVVHALTLGSFIIMNLWDFITYIFVTGVVLLLWGLVWSQQTAWRSLIRAVGSGFIVVLGATLAYALFFRTYHFPAKGAGFSYFNDGGHHSPIVQFLLIHFFPLFALVGWMISTRRRRESTLPKEVLYVIAGVAGLIVFVAFFVGVHLVLILLPALLIATFIYAIKLHRGSLPARIPMHKTRITEVPRTEGPSRAAYYTLCLFLAALCILLGVEIIHVDETYGKALQRLNTIFKFYMPVWFLLGLAMTYAIYSTIRRLRLNTPQGAAFAGACGLLLFMCLIFPFFWCLGQIRYYNITALGRPTLNGMAWMRNNNPNEYSALMWLRENVKEQPNLPVILEQTGPPFCTQGDYGRVSSNTGLPTILGWGNHVGLYRREVQKQPNGMTIDLTAKDIGDRTEAVRKIYAAATLDEAKPLLEKYKVRYIFVGSLERKDFPNSLDKFKTLPVATQYGDVVVYEY